MTMRGPCEGCGADTGAPLRRFVDDDTRVDMMLCTRCYEEERVAHKRCNRCGGRHMLTSQTVTTGGVDVDVLLCVRCKRDAERDNERALARRTGKDVL